MSLTAHDQRVLNSIEEGLASSDPGLAPLLAAFARLSAGEELPTREQIRSGRRRAHHPARARRRPRHGASSRPRAWPGWALALL